MSISSWLNNKKVSFFVVPYEEKKYLVCTANGGPQTVHFVEELETGKRAVPKSQPLMESGTEIDAFVIELINSL